MKGTYFDRHPRVFYSTAVLSTLPSIELGVLENRFALTYDGHAAQLLTRRQRVTTHKGALEICYILIVQTSMIES